MKSPDGFGIRPAEASDIPLLLTLIRELAEHTRLSSSMEATEDGLRSALFSDPPAARAILGELQGKPVAFAVYFWNFSTFTGKPGLYLEDLFVNPDFRSRGLGRVILAHLARLALSRGCGRMEWSVLNWNERAIEFYASLGAEPLREWTKFRLSGDGLQLLADGES